MTETQKDHRIMLQLPISSESQTMLGPKKPKRMLDPTLKKKSKNKLHQQTTNLNQTTTEENIEKQERVNELRIAFKRRIIPRKKSYKSSLKPKTRLQFTIWTSINFEP